MVQALLRADVGPLTVANRTLTRAESLAELARSRGVDAEAVTLESDRVDDAARSAQLIVNCTSLGMTHGPDETASPLRADQIPPTALVYDLVYNPALTPLLREAEQAGATTMGGITMLVYQGRGVIRDLAGQARSGWGYDGRCNGRNADVGATLVVALDRANRIQGGHTHNDKVVHRRRVPRARADDNRGRRARLPVS